MLQEKLIIKLIKFIEQYYTIKCRPKDEIKAKSFICFLNREESAGLLLVIYAEKGYLNNN